MEYKPFLKKDTFEIDSFELLLRFIKKCKSDASKRQHKAQLISSCADIVAAVYYFRRFPNVTNFIKECLKDKDDYFQIQWTRATWASLSNMSEVERCNLVINQIYMVDHSEEG